jgi:hypothetical protein
MQCHFCGGDGKGSGGYGHYGDQCGRCFDARPILRRRGWCMTTSEAINPHVPWRELTPRELAKWTRYCESLAPRATDLPGRP